MLEEDKIDKEEIVSDEIVEEFNSEVKEEQNSSVVNELEDIAADVEAAIEPETKGKPEKGPLMQLILFCILSMLGFAVQMLIITFLPKLCIAIKASTETTLILSGAFRQSIASFVGFLVGNVVAKLLSYFLNRKTTFNARTHFTFSITVYVIMCVALIIVETIIGTPFAELLYGAKEGSAAGNALGRALGYELCKIAATIIYSMVDFFIVFLMNKFVIMNDHLFDNKEQRAAYKIQKVEDAKLRKIKRDETIAKIKAKLSKKK